MSKKKLIVNYDKLPPGVLSQIEKQYPDGWMNHVMKVKGPKDAFIYVILVETEEVDYLIKMKVKKDRKGVENEEDFLPEFNDLSSSNQEDGNGAERSSNDDSGQDE
ncbi:MAG TPA: hypothetical protein P5531_04985 [Bacteroidales bacterium]|nr:hypothetical protein [Bacteroidales bacterium]HSA42642.1 hypothetical protein [Bacteroidales bacterium]